MSYVFAGTLYFPISPGSDTKAASYFTVKNNWKPILRSKLYIYIYIYICGSGSSVGIATDYGLDDPGSNPGGDEIFRLSRPALGPSHSPEKWVPGLSRG